MRRCASTLHSSTADLFAWNSRVVHVPFTSFRLNVPSVQRKLVAFTLYEVHVRDLKAKVTLQWSQEVLECVQFVCLTSLDVC
jgi:hypothetical protein